MSDPEPEITLVEWMREQAPWAIMHLAKRIGPDEHQAQAMKELMDNCSAAAARIANLEAALFAAGIPDPEDAA